MKNARKLLRKLLTGYRDDIVKRPYTKERSRIVDVCTILIEEIRNEKR